MGEEPNHKRYQIAQIFPHSELICDECSTSVRNDTDEWLQQGVWTHELADNDASLYFCSMICATAYAQKEKGIRLLQEL